MKNYLIRNYGDYQIVVDENTQYLGIKKNDDGWFIRPVYDYIDYFKDENVFMAVMDEGEEDSRYYLYNSKGELIVDNINFMYGFVNGICVVEKDNGLLNIINEEGNFLLENDAIEITLPYPENNKCFVNVIDVDSSNYCCYFVSDGTIIKK